MDSLQESPDKHCRTCMKILDSQQFNILEMAHLSLWLKMWASLEVEDNDPLPKYLCRDCYMRIEDFHEFSKMCIESAKKYYEIVKKSNQKITPQMYKEEGEKIDDKQVDFEVVCPFEIKNKLENVTDSEHGNIVYDTKNYSDNSNNDDDDDDDFVISRIKRKFKRNEKYSCKICGKKYLNKGKYKACLKKHDEQQQLACTHCGKTYKKQTSLQNHIKTWHEKKSEIFQCPVKDCNKLYKLKESIQKHCKLSHKINYDLENDLTIVNKNYTEDNRQERDNNQSEYTENNGKSSVIDEYYGFSTEKGEDQYEIEKKNKLRNGNREIFTCETCNKRFMKKEKYEACVKKHQGLKPWICKICGKGYRKQYTLHSHINSKHTENPTLYPCIFEGCSKSFTMKATMRAHYNVVHLNKYPPVTDCKYMCQECGKCFKYNHRLTKHLYTHTGSFPFKCERCPKSFSTRYLLDVHNKKHDGIKNFVCTICGMRKATRNELKAHMNYHLKENVIKCKFCPYNSCNIGNVVRHEKLVHLGERSFKCRYCDNSFGKAETLKHHEMIHTGEKPHECKECGRRFIQPTALKTHMKCHLKGTIRPLPISISNEKSNTLAPA